MLSLKQLHKRIQIKRAYSKVFSGPDGKLVLEHILSVSGATSPKFSTDKDQLLWNEAQRHFALSIFRQVHSSDQLPEHMLEELNNQEKEEQL